MREEYEDFTMIHNGASEIGHKVRQIKHDHPVPPPKPDCHGHGHKHCDSIYVEAGCNWARPMGQGNEFYDDIIGPKSYAAADEATATEISNETSWNDIWGSGLKKLVSGLLNPQTLLSGLTGVLGSLGSLFTGGGGLLGGLFGGGGS